MPSSEYTSDGAIDTGALKAVNERLKKLESKLADKKSTRQNERNQGVAKRATVNAKAKAKRAEVNKKIKASGASGTKVAEKRAAKKTEVQAKRASKEATRQTKKETARSNMKGNKVAKGAAKARRYKAKRSA
tara:strand:+ start:49 stop:444 length:396 start_codon:yes stop_codon:yes gene_type:complete